MRREDSDLVAVSLDINSLPAIYTPTQGRQKAYVEEANFTDVNLGLAVLPALSGTVKVMDKGNLIQNLEGVRVMLIQDIQKDPAVKDSITAYDGSFYIGQIKPGDYFLKIDPATVPDTCELRTTDRRKISIIHTGKSVEIEDCDIYLDPKKTEIAAKEVSSEGSKKIEKVLDWIEIPVDENAVRDEIIAAEQALIMSKARDTLLYIYGKITVPAYNLHTTDAVTVTL